MKGLSWFDPWERVGRLGEVSNVCPPRAGAEERRPGPPSHRGDGEQSRQRAAGVQRGGRCQQPAEPPGEAELLLGVGAAEDRGEGAAAAVHAPAGQEEASGMQWGAAFPLVLRGWSWGHTGVF